MFAGRYLSIMFLCWYPTLLSVRFLLHPITNMSSAAPRQGGGDARTISSKCPCFLVSVLLLAQLCCRLLFFNAFFLYIYIPLFFIHIFVLPEFLNLGECFCCLHILTSYILKTFFFLFPLFFPAYFVQPVMKTMSSHHSE